MMREGAKMEKSDFKKRAWTARGTMQEADKKVIAAITERNKVAARIFVTGVVHKDYVGDEAFNLLGNINDVYTKNGVMSEPLFIGAMDDTMRMTRFDPEFVWRCFHPDTLVELVQAEIDRLGLKMDPWAMDHMDFYESMVASATNEFGVPKVKKGYDLEWFYNSVYLSCLLLFRKPGYMDVPVAQHFASPLAAEHLKWVEYRELNTKEKDEVLKLREQYGKIQALTNAELNFVIGLFEKGK